MNTLLACHECDLIHRIQPLAHKGVAQCSRCGASLYRKKKNSLDRTLALTIAGLALFVLANSFPLLSMKIQAQVQHCTLFTGIKELYAAGKWEVSLLVLLTTIAVKAQPAAVDDGAGFPFLARPIPVEHDGGVHARHTGFRRQIGRHGDDDSGYFAVYFSGAYFCTGCFDGITGPPFDLGSGGD
jgi:hypothetical protein